MTTSVIAIALVLGGLIFFHELGHFLVAKVFRIGINTFSLGFGPRLTGFSLGQTDYVVSAVPLGGYVQLVGESPEAELPEGFSEADSFSLRPAWQKMLVVAAGPIFNLVLAWAIYFLIFVFAGQQLLLPTVGEVVLDSPAHQAGVETGDRVLRINGQKIAYWNDLAGVIEKNKENPLRLRVERDQTLLDFRILPELETTKNLFGEEIKVPRIGIVAANDWVERSMGVFESAWAGLVQTWKLFHLTVTGIIKMIEQVVPLESIGGPIMIAQLVSQQAQNGLVDVLALAALISINLALLNLLPIPVLDGGHLLFFGLEVIFRRPIKPKWQSMATRVGLSLLILLMALAVYNDIFRIISSQ